MIRDNEFELMATNVDYWRTLATVYRTALEQIRSDNAECDFAWNIANDALEGTRDGRA